MTKYNVTYDNEFLGINTRVMTRKEISVFNKVALYLSYILDNDDQEHEMGMWHVEKHNE